jgi:release factor glutamine methyltransferase
MQQTTYSRGQDLLSDCGKFYLVSLAQNNIPEIRERMRKKFNMNSRVRAVL